MFGAAKGRLNLWKIKRGNVRRNDHLLQNRSEK
jgi:hypothetical protein